MSIIHFEIDGRPFGYDFPARELLAGWDEYEDGCDELDNLGEDVDILVEDEAAWLVRCAEDPQLYHDWQADGSLDWPPEDFPDDPIVTA